MTSLMALRPSAFIFSSLFPALSPRRRSASLSSFLEVAPPKPFPNLRLSSSLGFCSKKREDSLGADAGVVKLEAEIYEFMEKSKNPSLFPTREELIAAGRADLAVAIAKEGGWLAYGWDLEQEEDQEDDGISQLRFQDGSLEADSCSSSSGGSMETEAEEEEAEGIEGILSRLERERSLSYGVDSLEKRVNGKASWRDGEHDLGDDVLIANGKAVGSINRSRRSISSGLDEQLFHNYGGAHSQKGTSAHVSGLSTTPMWKIWSLQRAGNPAMQFEASEVGPNKERHVNHNFNDNVSVDENEVARSVSKIGEESKGSHTDTEDIFQNQLHLRLEHLESELTSTLHLLRSRSKGSVSYKDQESSLKELHKLSDELEFKQTEIMNAKDKLRSTRAKMAIQQGKMMIIETQKRMDVRNTRLDAAQKALCLLHSTCIVWPNSASDVLLAGSFDGWTNQRRMERSKSGIFTLHLKLYPGRYEIKFVVDGMWMIDPLRPIVCSNGYENNLLIIP